MQSPSLIAKCAFEQFHLFLPGNSFNADDVEAVVYIMEVIPPFILASHAANLSLFAPMHSLFRPAVREICAGLHLNERQRVTIPSDEIYFAKALSIVAGDDLVTVLTEITICAAFPGRAFFLVEECSSSRLSGQVVALQSGGKTRVKPVQQCPRHWSPTKLHAIQIM